jgi:hypothetical protein
MNKKWHLVVALSAVLGVAASPSPTPSPSQGPELNAVMREKLVKAQKILEAVVTSDWVGLETNSRELMQLTKDPRWTVLRFPEYAQHSKEFISAVEDLHRAAARRDLVEAPKAYVAVTLQCVECHRYLARARVATAR